MKKIITFLLVFVLTVGIVPVGAIYAQEVAAAFDVEVNSIGVILDEATQDEAIQDKVTQIEAIVKATVVANCVTLTLNYDSELLTFSEFKAPTGGLNFKKRDLYDNESGKISIGGITFGANNVTYTDQEIFRVIFDVNPNLDVDSVFSDISVEIESRDNDLLKYEKPPRGAFIPIPGEIKSNKATIEFTDGRVLPNFTVD